MTVFNKFLLLALLVALSIPAPKAEHLVIAAVNDTHSQITPAADNKGGLLRRRAIYDQIRRENKNTMIIHPKAGSYFFLGEIYIDRAIDISSEPIINHCGGCTRCLKACPTDAIVEPFQSDAGKCIS